LVRIFHFNSPLWYFSIQIHIENIYPERAGIGYYSLQRITTTRQRGYRCQLTVRYKNYPQTTRWMEYLWVIT